MERNNQVDELFAKRLNVEVSRLTLSSSHWGRSFDTSNVFAKNLHVFMLEVILQKPEPTALQYCLHLPSFNCPGLPEPLPQSLHFSRFALIFVANPGETGRPGDPANLQGESQKLRPPSLPWLFQAIWTAGFHKATAQLHDWFKLSKETQICAYGSCWNSPKLKLTWHSASNSCMLCKYACNFGFFNVRVGFGSFSKTSILREVDSG